MMPRLKPTIAPLESGDRLTRDEFERRYHLTPESFKAELVEGVVYVASPVRIYHGTPHAAVMGWLAVYWAATPGTQLADNSTVRLNLDSEPQPDALLRIKVGGCSQISQDGYVEGAPELAVEIATSSVSLDLGAKLQMYCRSGVKEYIVWQVFDDRLDWFVLQDGQYANLLPNDAGVLCSQVFPGLWLDPQAMVVGNLAQVLTVLQQGLQTAAHQTLVERLQA
jgi:Uma2 family endonuclease